MSNPRFHHQVIRTSRSMHRDFYNYFLSFISEIWAKFQYKDHLFRYRDFYDKSKMIFIRGIPMLVRQHLYIEMIPWYLIQHWQWIICWYTLMGPCHASPPYLPQNVVNAVSLVWETERNHWSGNLFPGLQILCTMNSIMVHFSNISH